MSGDMIKLTYGPVIERRMQDEMRRFEIDMIMDRIEAASPAPLPPEWPEPPPTTL